MKMLTGPFHIHHVLTPLPINVTTLACLLRNLYACANFFSTTASSAQGWKREGLKSTGEDREWRQVLRIWPETGKSSAGKLTAAQPCLGHTLTVIPWTHVEEENQVPAVFTHGLWQFTPLPCTQNKCYVIIIKEESVPYFFLFLVWWVGFDLNQRRNWKQNQKGQALLLQGCLLWPFPSLQRSVQTATSFSDQWTSNDYTSSRLIRGDTLR